MTDAVTMHEANELVDRAIAHRRSRGFQPLTVAVLDAGGRLIVVKREDLCGFLRVDIAIGKANGALGFGIDSSALAERARQLPSFMAAVASLAPGGVVPAAGGVVLRSENGVALGAIGVSGDTSEHDEECVRHALRKTRFASDA